jgi:hypothetical protein
MFSRMIAGFDEDIDDYILSHANVVVAAVTNNALTNIVAVRMVFSFITLYL